MLLLDANVCIDVLRGRAEVVARLDEHGPAGLFLCTVVKAELAYGARLASEPERAVALVDAFCEPFPSLPFDQTGDQTGVADALLGPLASDGGQTQTHSLLAGSPAINAGTCADADGRHRLH